MTLWLQHLRDDIRFALRQLRKAPAFAVIASATLALGIGANSAIFALVDATLLRPLPFPNPDRLVMVWEQTPRSNRVRVSPPTLNDWNEQSRAFEVFGGYVGNVGGMVMAGADGTAETVARQWVSWGYFAALGLQPLAGRTFNPEDARQGASLVVLSESFWRSRYSADPTVVGRAVRLDGSPFTIVGVVPDQAQILKTSIWALDARQLPRTAAMFQVVGRLKPGVGIDAAASEMSAIAKGLEQQFPQTNTGRGVALQPMHEALIGTDLRRTALLFLGVVGFVLLICCANVANLLLVRATGRMRELATRTALGATRQRVIRQLLTESLVLALIGGGAGMAVGAAILRIAPAYVPDGLLPPSITLGFDTRLIIFCALATLVIGVLFGVAPAIKATNVSTAQVLAADNRTSTGRGGRMRALLVVGEVAVAVVLMFGAGLLLRTLIAVNTVDRGYRAEGVLTMMVDPLGSQFPNSAALDQFFVSLEQDIRSLPHVESAGWASTLPMGPSVLGQTLFEIVGDPPFDDSTRPAADLQLVSTSYFPTVDLPIVAGRVFDDRDNRNSVPVCIVNEAFVRGYVQGRSPIGLQIAIRQSPTAKPLIREIVGVARQVKGRPDEPADLLQIYVPLKQIAIDDMYLLVRPRAGRAELLTSAVRAAVARQDKDQTISVRDVLTLDEVAGDATARQRFRSVLVTTFAGLALLLALIGVFGILAYTIQQRGRDLAVRRALGATTSDMLRLVITNAVALVASGVVIGLTAAALLARLIATMLYGVVPLDPLTFGAVTAIIALTTAVSIAAPAWRASRIDPAEALRAQ